MQLSAPTKTLVDHYDTEKKINSYAKTGYFGGIREITEEDIQKWKHIEKLVAKNVSSDCTIGG